MKHRRRGRRECVRRRAQGNGGGGLDSSPTDPAGNPLLGRVIQSALGRHAQRQVEAAIKRASGKDATDFEEILCEGYYLARRRG